MSPNEATEARAALEPLRDDLEMARRRAAARYQATKSPVDDAVACAVAAALGALEREIDRIGGGR